jgi:periplasmic protein CpxP/Spy
MKLLSRLTAVVALVLAVAGGGGLVSAQTAQPQTRPGAMPGQMMRGQGSHDPVLHMCRDSDAHLAGMLAYSETKLGITEAQRPNWKKLTDTIQSAREPIRKVCADLGNQPAPTALPARLERMERMMEARTEAMRKVVPAVSQFYGTLTPDQQKIADDLIGHGHGGGHGMMGH